MRSGGRIPIIGSIDVPPESQLRGSDYPLVIPSDASPPSQSVLEKTAIDRYLDARLSGLGIVDTETQQNFRAAFVSQFRPEGYEGQDGKVYVSRTVFDQAFEGAKTVLGITGSDAPVAPSRSSLPAESSASELVEERAAQIYRVLDVSSQILHRPIGNGLTVVDLSLEDRARLASAIAFAEEIPPDLAARYGIAYEGEFGDRVDFTTDLSAEAVRIRGWGWITISPPAGSPELPALIASYASLVDAVMATGADPFDAIIWADYLMLTTAVALPLTSMVAAFFEGPLDETRLAELGLQSGPAPRDLLGPSTGMDPLMAEHLYDTYGLDIAPQIWRSPRETLSTDWSLSSSPANASMALARGGTGVYVGESIPNAVLRATALEGVRTARPPVLPPRR